MPTKTDKDLYLGLAPAEAKIILRALLFAEDIKPDYKLLAEKHGVTLNSARSMFPKAMKRWRELNASPPQTQAPSEADPTTADEDEAQQEDPKPKKSHGSGQKRKRGGGDQPQPEAELAENSASAASAESLEGNITSTNDAQAPKPKKSRGKGRKAKHVEDAPAPVVEEPVYEPESEPRPGIELAEGVSGNEPAIQGEPERASIHCEEHFNEEDFYQHHHTVSGYHADDDLA